MLNALGVDYRYREYKEEPLTVDELKATLALLDMEPKDLLRMRDAAAAGVGQETPAGALLAAMAAQPTLVQRPILTNGERAILARPADLMKDFLE